MSLLLQKLGYGLLLVDNVLEDLLLEETYLNAELLAVAGRADVEDKLPILAHAGHALAQSLATETRPRE